MKPLAYLACPYSGTPDEIESRVSAFVSTFARLETEGEMHIVSPVMNHLVIERECSLPGNWAFWQSYSLTLLKRCDQLLVLRVPGWEHSTGVRGEIEFAEREGIPITYIDVEAEHE